MPTRILHVLEPTDGGVPEWVRLVAEAQAERGASVGIASVEQLSDKVAFHKLEIGRSNPMSLRHGGQTIRELATDYDLVHLHSFFAGMAGRLIDPGVPTVFHPHGWVHQMDSRKSQLAGATVERTLASRSEAIATVNLQETQHGIDAGIDARYHEVGVPVDLGRFDSLPTKDSARRALGVAGHLAVCVGRLCTQKGQRQMIEQWDSATGGAITLVLVGPVQDSFDMPERLPDSIIHTGRTDPAPWLAAADVVVQPSHWEGQSIAVGEALAAARPVVAFDVTGMRQAILDGDRPPAGAVVPKGAYELLLHEVMRRMSDPMRRLSEGKAGRQRAHDLFSANSMADRLDDLYEELLSSRRSPRCLGVPRPRRPSPGVPRPRRPPGSGSGLARFLGVPRPRRPPGSGSGLAPSALPRSGHPNSIPEGHTMPQTNSGAPQRLRDNGPAGSQSSRRSPATQAAGLRLRAGALRPTTLGPPEPLSRRSPATQAAGLRLRAGALRPTALGPPTVDSERPGNARH
ncbi:MAG: glycosyltransferase [Acidimicrobiales bacterium]